MANINLLARLPFIKNSNKPRQVVSADWNERTSILQPDVNLFCWQREGGKRITDYLTKRVNTGVVPYIQVPIKSDQLLKQVREARLLWEEGELPEGDFFWSDVLQVVADFLRLSNRESGIMHLKMIENDACKKFHTDGYYLRLFTTYLGPGTEWLPEEAVNRSGLGKTNDLIVKKPALIQRMNTFDVGILKGEPHANKLPVKGIVHRSPEVAATGEKRIILRVDI